MSITKTIGGDRIGSGQKMKAHLHGYERSTHDLSYIWRSTMGVGPLVPFLVEPILPGDTFDINLDTIVFTKPAIGPLFGSMKLQLDVYFAPARLYQGQLHNNKRKIGMNMASVKLPQMMLTALPTPTAPGEDFDIDNSQINPSCILSYLGIRGVGINATVAADPVSRDFDATPWLAYWDIYKTYYVNQQEEIGAVIHSPTAVVDETWVSTIEIYQSQSGIDEPLGNVPPPSNLELSQSSNLITVTGTGVGTPNYDDVYIQTSTGDYTLQELAEGTITQNVLSHYIVFNASKFGTLNAEFWRYRNIADAKILPPIVQTFPLDNLDDMREYLLTQTTAPAGVQLHTGNTPTPYNYILHTIVAQPNVVTTVQTQEGLAIKTYQSDVHNNWLQTEWIDGPGGISELTAIDTSSGEFTIDTLVLSRKIYDMLNRIAVSGGTYNDWIEVQYDTQVFAQTENPVYLGGLSKEIVFQEVISNSESQGPNGTQPLGSLAGRGTLGKKHKGGHIIAKTHEIGYLIGIVSITPRLDYSQGNRWYTQLKTMDDFHKPALDEIGFQEDINETRAWWSTRNTAGTWETTSAGKLPAWINYITNVNRTYGNFAIKPPGEMFMTLNRQYEWDGTGIQDLTTYIDPAKYNHIFAETSIDAQNFWVQISVDIEARRKMSAKIMPNL